MSLLLLITCGYIYRPESDMAFLKLRRLGNYFNILMNQITKLKDLVMNFHDPPYILKKLGKN
ncbi:hypothetical protein MCGE09_00005 [Thaumarchaeota archaeon SCGC AB-539-E09]|nr:hypothetical protein MCGE09_00005 [Thaumarchaeota archaeon SCGC AB-539-E09]